MAGDDRKHSRDIFCRKSMLVPTLAAVGSLDGLFDSESTRVRLWKHFRCLYPSQNQTSKSIYSVKSFTIVWESLAVEKDAPAVPTIH